MFQMHTMGGFPNSILELALHYLLLLNLSISIFTNTASAEPIVEVDLDSLDYSQAENAPVRRAAANGTTYNHNIIIYGSTPAAITAAMQISAMGEDVAIVCPEQHIGGMTASGLGWTDSKDGGAIGGIARQFYSDVYTYYLNTSVWTEETRKTYVARGISAQPGPAVDTAKQVQWTFEPHVAEAIFEKWMSDQKVTIYRGEYVWRNSSGVSKSGSKILSFNTESGNTYTAKQFIDAGYEGDLMASAGVNYLVGRDPHDLYDEHLAGMQLNIGNESFVGRGSAYSGVDPYIIPGNASSGLLHGIEVSYDELPSNFTGAQDDFRLQSYMYRLCLTRKEDNQVNFTKPSNYNESEYELLLRYIEAGHASGFTTQLMPNGKTDSNSKGEVTLDFLGGNYDDATGLSYTEASYAQRQSFLQSHKDYQQGILYTLIKHPRVPAALRHQYAQWGLAADEFADNDNWPYQLYIREARRMKGFHTLSQQDVQNTAGYFGDAIAGLGSYSFDSHAIRRVVLDGKLYDEGWFYMPHPSPYPIPLGTIMPRKADATNFLNPVTVSATHVALGSVRMEPTYMILGQSAGIAAVMALQSGKNVQDIDRMQFMKNMYKYNQTLSV